MRVMVQHLSCVAPLQDIAREMKHGEVAKLLEQHKEAAHSPQQVQVQEEVRNQRYLISKLFSFLAMGE